jgi:SAM-dependent methyltransferase
MTKNIDLYDSIAEVYDDYYVSDQDNKENEAVKYSITTHINGKVLDIGSGTGLLLDLLDNDDFEYVGLDPSKKMIEVAKSKHENCSFINGTVLDVEGKFNSIISLFGVPSLLTREELENLKDKCDNSDFYFLMHYKDGYSCRLLEDTLDQKEDITKFDYDFYTTFKDARIFTLSNYIIITNKNINMERDIGMTHSQMERFVKSREWTFAKTYAKKAPHEYIVKDHLSQPDKRTFEKIAQFIRDNGEERSFWSKKFIYYRIDNKEYWTYGDPIKDTIILNRANI